MRVNVFGLGYVGSVVALELAALGHDMIGIEIAQEKVENFKKGKLPIFESGLQERLEKALAQNLKGRFHPQSSFSAQDLQNTQGSIICVGTPSVSSGEVDLSQIRKTLTAIAQALKGSNVWHAIIIRSTVPPGTTQNVLIPLIEEISGKKQGVDFGVGFYPEFLREGSAVKDFESPSLNVLGCCDDSVFDFVRNVFTVSRQLVRVQIQSAEMIKYANNSFHALKVVFANEIGSLGKAYGVDTQELIDVFLSDTILNISGYYLRPGFAFGGSCLPKELRAISHLLLQKNMKAPLINAIQASNDEHANRLTSLIQQKNITRVAFLGVTFKPDTDDIRESPLLKVVAALLAGPSYKKHFEITLCDTPEVLEKIKAGITHAHIRFEPEALKAVKNNDLLILGPYRLDPNQLKVLEEYQGSMIDLKWFDVSQAIKNKQGYYSFC